MRSFKLLQVWQENRGNVPSASQSLRSGEGPRPLHPHSSSPRRREHPLSSSFLPSQGPRSSNFPLSSSSFLPSQVPRSSSFPRSSSLVGLVPIPMALLVGAEWNLTAVA